MICLKIRTFVVSATTPKLGLKLISCCDLLENSYLCGISNNSYNYFHTEEQVVICLKIRTFVVSATTDIGKGYRRLLLWFAWKFVPLWYQQQHITIIKNLILCCDLLENSYLCGISNNSLTIIRCPLYVVICLKIRTFVVSATTSHIELRVIACCDLLENSYLCGISNNYIPRFKWHILLWFAWKFVPLWYQQQQDPLQELLQYRCDLLENSYLCGISNNQSYWSSTMLCVVICLKIRTFVVSATTKENNIKDSEMLWFAWKFVPLWYQQQLLILIL